MHPRFRRPLGYAGGGAGARLVTLVSSTRRQIERSGHLMCPRCVGRTVTDQPADRQNHLRKWSAVALVRTGCGRVKACAQGLC